VSASDGLGWPPDSWVASSARSPESGWIPARKVVTWTSSLERSTPPFAPDDVDAARALLDGGAHVAIDCSGSEPGRGTAIALVRERGRVVLVGEGNGLTAPEVTLTLIHPSITIIGSWVTSLKHTRELVPQLPAGQLHSEVTVSDTFPLADADAAYRLADAGRSGKIALIP
jgi:threonine dehydrogenase-like Zn-dependent dehydrogenase